MTIKEQLVGLRGKAYCQRFDELFEPISGDFARRLHKGGTVTLGKLLQLCDEYGLPFKPTVEGLEKRGDIRYGTMDELTRNGINLTKLRKHLAEREAQA